MFAFVRHFRFPLAMIAVVAHVFCILLFVDMRAVELLIWLSGVCRCTIQLVTKKVSLRVLAIEGALRNLLDLLNGTSITQVEEILIGKERLLIKAI